MLTVINKNPVEFSRNEFLEEIFATFCNSIIIEIVEEL
jgi:hypothetical protein